VWYHQPQKQRISLIPDQIWTNAFIQILLIKHFLINGREPQNFHFIHEPQHPNKNVNEPFSYDQQLLETTNYILFISFWFKGIIPKITKTLDFNFCTWI
jgi:hypothetical protein